MSKAMVKASQKKRRISNRERDDLNHLEEKQNEKLAGQIEPPSFLSRKQKNTFRRLVESLEAINVVSSLDSDILGHYVYFQSVFEDLKKLVDDEGYVLNGKTHPALAEMRQVSKVVYTYQNKLGLNPSDRMRFVDKVEEEEDELDAFLNDSE